MAFKQALVVDDSKLARITLKKKLEQRGLQVALAESGLQALEVLRAAGEGECVDIIFMDHLMPELDGFETTQKIKADRALAHIPVIMCSGKDNDDYLQEAQAIGATSVLSKPPETSALEAILALEVVEPAPVLEDTIEATDALGEASFEALVVEDKLEAPVLTESPTGETVEADAIFDTAPEFDTTPETISEVVAESTSGLDRDAVVELTVGLIKEHLPETARQREDILAELSKTQTRILEDFSGGVDQQLTAHQDALAQLRQELAALSQNQLSTPPLDEGAIVALIETRLNTQREEENQHHLAEQQDQKARAEQAEHQLNDQLEALSESTLQTEVKLSAMEQRLQEKFSEFEQKLTDLPASPQAENDQIDWETITEQASRAAVSAAQQGIQQTVEQVIEQRIAQISADISDQVQLQITYQLSQLEEKNPPASAPTVDEVMGVSDEQIQAQLQNIVEAQLTEQLKSKLSALQGELVRNVTPDSATIQALVDERLAETLNPQASADKENAGMDSSAVSQQQLDEMAAQFAQTQQQIVGRSRRTTIILGLFVGLSALAVIAQWMS